MEPGLLIFLSLVGFTGFGVLWFYVLEPAWDGLSAWRQAGNHDIMSNDATPEPADNRPSAASERQTDQTQTPDQTADRKPPTDVLRSLRQHGYSRNEARELLRQLGYTLDNNAWTQAAPPPPVADDEIITPWAGRRTKASYYPDSPDLEYEAPN